MQLLINHLGYEQYGHKQAVIQSASAIDVLHAELLCRRSHQPIMQLPLETCGPVDQWHTGLTYTVDFSALTECGKYQLRVGENLSEPFAIAEGLLMTRTFSDVLHYFKSQRCGGKFDLADQAIPLLGTDTRVDVRGGWYDASGDVSKYLSHLSFSNYFNPQQIPMVVWNMLTAFDALSEEPAFSAFTRTRLLEEALHGADFLMNMQSERGFFYTTVFDKWSKQTDQREICSYAHQSGNKTTDYQAGFRQGAGVAIAALAAACRILQGPAASQIGYPAVNSARYLTAAEHGYWHLIECNQQYLDDGCENIIDEYCALLAAVELFRATDNSDFLKQARLWADKLAQRQHSDSQQNHYWSANGDGSRPYFHAAEAGLPVISLLHYLAVEPEAKRQQALSCVVANAVAFELDITHEVTNPFGYPRQYTKPLDGSKASAFFIPHHNETGYWWQGENARLASLASMAFLAAGNAACQSLRPQLKAYGQQLLDWLLGLNPFDISMLDGHGRNNPDYLPEQGFFNARGGVCNGITSGFDNEHDIAFNPAPQHQGILQNWRWGEQWIPHAAWYLLAVALQYKERHND
ncbi:glycoside hydrolase family 9 protein [Photobacterium sp. ZSDE20]|uniref:Glycoside hydrolase family 9 protein n=1 Tax=Photobacterium pectinilyticum TaxID=2906793 RepID=A0ABT1N2I6_9GAMM|nr:glycoside hydrolase family 9 protein [Photobacterium sp. ZSDE20]MCQ1058943.1 glycoside hydrolase family 9 protein [Photobacterium sp. ZSDE20]MDD1823948.1 glycoside hydrolase family 9 protein [Photobacterium sp. ZSDE20]